MGMGNIVGRTQVPIIRDRMSRNMHAARLDARRGKRIARPLKMCVSFNVVNSQAPQVNGTGTYRIP
jgi:hypothetical protein